MLAVLPVPYPWLGVKGLSGSLGDLARTALSPKLRRRSCFHSGGKIAVLPTQRNETRMIKYQVRLEIKPSNSASADSSGVFVDSFKRKRHTEVFIL